MKTLVRSLMFVAALMAAWTMNAQELSSYSFATGVDSTKWITLTDYTDISGTGSGDSWASSVRNIGFTFPFGESSYTQFSVNSDGNLRLGSTVTGTSGYTTPFSSSNANSNNPKINFFGCDGYLVAGTHYIHSQLFGDTLLVIDYCLGPYSSTYRNNQFRWQIHLYNTGRIEAIFPESEPAMGTTHQMGMCENAASGLIVNSDYTMTAFTSGSSSNWASSNWPAAHTYFSFVPPVISCPRVYSVSFTEVTAHSATLHIDPQGQESAWQLTFSPAIQGQESMIATDTTVVLTMLNSASTYTVSCRAICDEGDTSDVREASFQTLVDCGEGYEYKNITLGTGTSASYLYTFYGSTTYNLGSTSAIFASDEMAPSNLYETNYINRIRLNVGSTGGTINDAHIYMRNTSKSEFASSGDSIAVDDMVEVFSGNIDCPANSWVNIDLPTPFAYNPDSNLIITFRRTGSVSANITFGYTSISGIYRSQYGYRTNTGTTISATRTTSRTNVDFVFCSQIPSCLPVMNLTATPISHNTANLNWTVADSNQHTFQIALGTVNNIDSMNTDIVAYNNINLTGLTPNTQYFVMVRAICDSTDSSAWCRTITFTTPCDVAESPLFVEDFETILNDDIPSCWNQGWYYQHPTSGVKTQPFKTSTSYHHSGSRAMTLQDQGNGTDSWMTTQKLPFDRSSKYALSVWVYRSSGPSYATEGLKFWLSNTTDTTGATCLGYIHRHYGFEPAEEATGWYNYQFPITEAGDKYILIEGISNYGTATYFDDVEVMLLPCEKDIHTYVEDFEHQDNNFVPTCWDNTTSTTPTLANNPSRVWGTYTYNGNKMMRMYNYFVLAGNALINSPSFVIDTNSTYELIFDYSHRASCGDFLVQISNDGGNTFNTVDTLQSTAYTDHNDPGIFASEAINLSQYAGDTIIVRFFTVADYNEGAIFVDNIRFREINNCLMPTGLTAELLSASSASISWTPADSAQAAFIVAYGTGTNPDEMDTIMANTNSIVINGLSAETNYNVFVKAICDSEHQSYWSDIASFYTGYCQPIPSSVDYDGIQNVTFGTNDEVVNNNMYPTTAPFYGNYYNQIGAVAAGTQAAVDITFYTHYTYGTIIWVDWNNNLTFDGNEVVYVGQSQSFAPTVLHAAFDIPATQDTGYYRMRIAAADDYFDSYIGSIASAAAADPCFTSYYAVSHDYTLHVTEAPSCVPSVGVTASNITNSSALITWIPGDTTQNNFVVAYGEGTNPDSLTTIGTNTSYITLNGLTNATNYNVFVKAACSADQQSTWSSMASFTTSMCAPEDQCLIFVEMEDEYGDGWNGASISLVDSATNATVHSFSFSNGSYASDSATVCVGRTYRLVWNTGSYDNECSFVASNISGQTIFSGSYLNAGTLTSFVANCTAAPATVEVTTDAMPALLGSVTGAGTYAIGDTVTLTATPAFNAHLVQWSNGDTASTISFVATQDTAFTAFFQLNPFTVTVVNNDSAMGYTIPAPGIYEFYVGDTISAIANAFNGHHFVNWEATLGFLTDTTSANPIFFVVDEMMAGLTMTATAHFAPNMYDIDVTSNYEGFGTVTGSGRFAYGTIDTIAAIAAENCHFSHWLDGDTNAVRAITVTSDSSFTAIFLRNSVTVLVSINDQAMGSTTPAPGTYTYYVGDTVSATATANEGYLFEGWNITVMGQTINYTDESIDIVIPAIAAGLTINAQAVFAPIPTYTVTLTVSDTLGHPGVGGTVTGAGEYYEGDMVTITATPDEGYLFLGWYNQSGEMVYTDATNTFEMDAEDITLNAVFVYSVGINDVAGDATVIYGTNNSIVVRNAENQTIRIFDAVGRLVAQRSAASIEEIIAMPTTGVYLVQVGNAAARRVVVRR